MTGAARRSDRTRFIEALRRFGADDKGATAIEYSLIVALIFIAIIAAVSSVADSTNDMYSDLTSAM